MLSALYANIIVPHDSATREKRLDRSGDENVSISIHTEHLCCKTIIASHYPSAHSLKNLEYSCRWTKSMDNERGGTIENRVLTCCSKSNTNHFSDANREGGNLCLSVTFPSDASSCCNQNVTLSLTLSIVFLWSINCVNNDL